MQNSWREWFQSLDLAANPPNITACPWADITCKPTMSSNFVRAILVNIILKVSETQNLYLEFVLDSDCLFPFAKSLKGLRLSKKSFINTLLWQLFVLWHSCSKLECDCLTLQQRTESNSHTRNNIYINMQHAGK